MKKLGLLIAVLILGVSNAWGFGASGRHARWPGYGMNPNFASNMNLTDDQRAKLNLSMTLLWRDEPLRDELFQQEME